MTRESLLGEACVHACTSQVNFKFIWVKHGRALIGLERESDPLSPVLLAMTRRGTILAMVLPIK
jgi:hypothetical protein